GSSWRRPAEVSAAPGWTARSTPGRWRTAGAASGSSRSRGAASCWKAGRSRWSGPVSRHGPTSPAGPLAAGRRRDRSWRRGRPVRARPGRGGPGRAGSTGQAAPMPTGAERVWGEGRRGLGVVGEYVGGIDHLPSVVAGFAPGPARRLGVLVDHLVDGSKESRIAAQVSSPQVLVVGHPFVDIWQAVRPASLGIAAWPAVPRGTPWKEGVLRALGWGGDAATGWRRILGAANSYTVVEPALLGRVEELIDFVPAPGSGDRPASL